jgi:hypothetical protein
MSAHEPEFQVAFESDTLEAAVAEVMRLAEYVGQDVTFLPGVDAELCNLKVPAEVQTYLMKAAQAAYDESGHATAGTIRKVVYRGVGVVFERIMGDELRLHSYDHSKPDPIHVAQFWKRLGRD